MWFIYKPQNIYFVFFFFDFVNLDMWTFNAQGTLCVQLLMQILLIFFLEFCWRSHHYLLMSTFFNIILRLLVLLISGCELWHFSVAQL